MAEEINAEKQSCGRRAPFVSFKGFVAIFCLTMLFNRSYDAYTDGVITQIEKQFGMSSADIGFYSSSNFYLGTVATLLLALLCKDMNHPRLVAIGGFMQAFACFLITLPHFIYGTSDFYSREIRNGSDVTVCYPDRPEEDCTEIGGTRNAGPFVILVISGIIRGVGETPLYPLGLTYAYTNADSPKAGAFAYGIVSALSSLGSLVGNTLGATLMSVHISLTKSAYKPSDPLWLGAWWLGFFIIGSGYVLGSVPLLFFPKTFKPRPQNIQTQEDTLDYVDKTDQKRGLWRRFLELDAVQSCIGTVKCIPAFMTMVILWLLMFKSVGFSKFFVKVIEVNFQLPANIANVIKAITGVAGALGNLLMGVVMGKLNNTRRIAYLYCTICLLCVITVTSQMFMGCESPAMQGFRQDNSLNLTLPCNSHCNCNTNSLTPVCGADGTNFFSPCHAGCTFQNLTDCACAPNSTLTEGWCGSTCKTVIPYLISYMMFEVLFEIYPGRVLQLRVLKEEHVSFAMSINGFIMNFVAFIPAPIVFGSIVDSTCLVWRDLGCGKQGSCWLYDNEEFWFRLHGLQAAVVLPALIFIGIILYVIRSYKDPVSTDWAGVENKAYLDDGQSRNPGSENAGEKHIQKDRIPIENSIYKTQYNDTKLHNQEITLNVQGEMDTYTHSQKSIVYEKTAL